MADSKDKPGALEDKDEFKKQEDKAGSGSEDAEPREKVADMVEKTKALGSTGL